MSAPMRGKRNIGGCNCLDCGNDEPPSRARENREWQREADADRPDRDEDR